MESGRTMTGKDTPRRTREQGCTAPGQSGRLLFPWMVAGPGAWEPLISYIRDHLSGCSPITPHIPNPHPSGTGTFFWALGATGFSSPANKALTSSATGTPLACSFCTCLTSCRMQDA